MNANDCPQKERLADYTSGKLSEEAAGPIVEHLGSCSICEATIQKLEAESNTLASGLRDPKPADTAAEGSEYQRVIERLAGLPKGDTGTPLPSPPSAEAPLEKLGPYLLLAKLGEGGMGAVYKARHEHLGKIVAVKILPAKSLQDAGAVARFRREMKAVGQMQHPNIVAAFDAGEANGQHYLVMEYAEGSDLSAIVKERGPIPVNEVVEYVRQAAAGLAYAHAQGLVHRDIKPANLLLDKKGTVRILDMGLARFEDPMGAGEGLTQSGQVMGTVDFMAPEQAFDTRQADTKADVYSLGCTIYRLLTGQSLYAGETLVQKLLAHREQSIPVLQKVCPDAPPALDALYQRMVAKKPSDRPSMAQVEAALQAIADEQRQAALAHSAASSGARKPPRRILVAAAAGFLFVLLGVWIVVRDKEGNKIAEFKAPDGASVTTHAEEITAAKTTEPRVTAPAVSYATPVIATSSTVLPPGPESGMLPGIVPRPASLPGIGRWQIETVAPRASKTACAVSPDDRLLAVGDEIGQIRIYELASWRLVAFMVGTAGPINNLSWSPDGKLLASCAGLHNNSDKAVRLWQPDGALVSVLDVPADALDVAWSPDGQTLLASFEGGFRLWRADGTVAGGNNTVKGRIWAVSWGPDSQQFVTGGDDKTVRIWNRDGTAGPILTGHEDDVRSVDWSHKGMIASRSGKSLRFWHSDGKPGATIAEGSFSHGMAWSPDGAQLAVCLGGNIAFYAPDGSRISLAKSTEPGTVVRWLSDGRQLVKLKREQGIDLVKLGSGTQSSLAAMGAPAIRVLSRNADGSRLATLDRDFSLRLWQSDGKPVRNAAALKGSTDIQFSPTGRIATSPENRDLHIFEPDGKPGPVIQVRPNINAFAWSPDGERIATVDGESKVQVWNADGTPADALEGIAKMIPTKDNHLVWTSKGEIVSGGFANDLRIWKADGTAGPVVATSSYVNSLTPSPDGRTLAVSEGNWGRLVVYDIDGNPRPVFKNAEVYPGVAWSPDGRQFVTASVRRLCWVNRAGNQQRMVPLPFETYRAVWSPNGQITVLEGRANSLLTVDAETGAPVWRSVMLPAGKSVTVSAGGTIVDGQNLEKSLVYLVEQDGGRLEPLAPSEFAKRVPSAFPQPESKQP